MTALWTVFSTLITKEPKSACQPASWRYDHVRQALMTAGELITAKEAERRVLILENPGLKGSSQITTSLYAGLQLVLPGEVAPAHRHAQSALRFVLEGSGAHTAVNGEKTPMQPGDFIITPQWAWHDHGNDTKQPMIWLDGLDIPMLKFYDASFAEGFGEDQQPIDRQTGDSLARYGANLLPVDHKRRGINSPVFNYPYERSRAALETMRAQNEWDACHGLKMKYVNPETGDYAMPTIGSFIQLLPKGFSTSRYRATDATIFVCVEGRGSSEIGGETIEWGPRDIFVAPSWHWVRHKPEEGPEGEAVLFSFSDRPVQEKLGFFRQDRANA